MEEYNKINYEQNKGGKYSKNAVDLEGKNAVAIGNFLKQFYYDYQLLNFKLPKMVIAKFWRF